MREGVLLPSDLPSEPGTQNKDTATAGQIFIENEIDFSNGFVGSVGMRFEDVNTKREELAGDSSTIRNRYQIFVPGVGVQYMPTPHWNLIAGIHKGMSAVTPGQAGEMKPEENIQYELGFKYKDPSLNKIKGEVIGFYNDYKNIKGFCSLSAGCEEGELGQEFNGGKAKIYGFESHFSWTFSWLSLDFPTAINYTKTFASFSEKVSSYHREWGLGLIRKGDPLPYIPVDKVSLSLGFEGGKWSSFFIYNWQSQVYDQSVAEGRKTIDSYSVVDWVGKYPYSKKGNVFLK